MNPSVAVAAVLLCAPAFGQVSRSTENFNPNTGNQSRDRNPAASNPNLPLPGTANANSRAAPMVPNPQPVPSPGGPIHPLDGARPLEPDGIPRAVPGPGGARGSPAQPEASPDPGRDGRILRDIREAVLRVRKGRSEPDVQDFKVARRGARVYLTGTAGSEAGKQAAGERAAEAAIGQEIVNQLRVRK